MHLPPCLRDRLGAEVRPWSVDQLLHTRRPHLGLAGRTPVEACRRAHHTPKAVPDHEGDAADNSATIDPRNVVRQREIRVDTAHPHLRKPDRITHDGAYLRRP